MDLPETLLVKALHGEQLQFQVLCNTRAGHYHLLRDAGIPVQHFVCRSRIDRTAIKYMHELLSADEFDLIHAFTSRLLSVVLLATRGWKDAPRIIAYRGGTKNVSRYSLLSRLTYLNRRVSAINCVCDAVRDYLLSQGVPAEKLRRIYKGHRPEWYQMTSEPPARALFNIPADAFIVGCVANMRPNKGIDVLLQAALQLADEPFFFLVVGDVRDKRVQKLANDPRLRERVCLTGLRNDVSEISRLFDVFVQPTKDSEGLPKAVLEAMCLEIPPVVTRIGGMIEIVRHERDGLVVNPNDPTALALAFRRLREDETLRLRLAKASRQRIETAFHFDQSVAETRKLYEQVAGGVPGSELTIANALSR